MQTDQLVLRRFTADDAEAYWPLVADPKILRYTGESPFESVEQVRQMLLERPLRDYAVHGFGRMACIEKESGRLVGFSGLKYLDNLQEVDIGYRFLPDCWGKGYATESARAIMRHGVREHGLQRIIGLVDPANLASARVLQKLGLCHEKRINPDWYATGLDLYAISTDGAGE
jgi:[ribosomal protein S5]-alanine N-acetyltransferase